MNDFAEILKQISAGRELSPEQADFAMREIIAGNINNSHIAAFLFGMSSKGETVSELTAFVNVMREVSVRVDVDTDHAIDLCGTGGDKSGTFNISTASMFVAAGADVPILKHGNAGVSSSSGSYDVLKSLGMFPDLHKELVEKCFRETRMAFMFAPLFHPAMARVMPVRKELGIRTFFNIMGPMLNPARVKRQVIGAFNRETARMMIRILANLGTEFAYTVYAEDGLDEFSTTSNTHVYQLMDGSVANGKTFDARTLGLSNAKPQDLKGGNPEENAAIIRAVLDDTATDEQREVVVLNATFAIHASGLCDDLQEAHYAALESLETGKAREALDRLIECTSDLRSEG
ncbi:MAG: anthranilate phosphoribosyltransferase [Balneolales bacterium]